MKERIRIERAVFVIMVGALLSALPARADKESLLSFSRACRDVSKAMLKNHPNPFKSEAEFEQALESVRTTLDQLRQLELGGAAQLSPKERTTLQDHIVQCSGALDAVTQRVNDLGRK